MSFARGTPVGPYTIIALVVSGEKCTERGARGFGAMWGEIQPRFLMGRGFGALNVSPRAPMPRHRSDLRRGKTQAFPEWEPTKPFFPPTTPLFECTAILP